jgi:GNAT superfamily N-acetyltransferase
VSVAVREIQDPVDVDEAARLRWRWVAESRDPGQDVDTFARDFARWWHRQPAAVGVVATTDAPDGSGASAVIGMAFLVVINRVPAPGELDRTSGDLQSVYVVPDHRGHGVGTQMLERLIEHARDRGCLRITVHSSSRALPYYRRLGFEHHERVLAHLLPARPDVPRVVVG